MSNRVDKSEHRILIVDDDQEVARLVSATLAYEGYSLNTASSGEKALAKMAEWEPHLVLLDINMPGLNGLETLRILRRKEAYVSVIFLSGYSETEDVIRGLDAGGDDYICKPFNPHELLARVRTQLRIKDLTDRLSEANEKLKALVETDDLTGLFNMRNVYKKLDLELSRGRRFGTSVCAVMMDMDHFKRVNDNNDHLFGSFVLAEVGKIIKNSIREVDFGARYGGDEFLVVLSGTDNHGAMKFAERVRKKIMETSFDNGEFAMNLTCSMGFAVTSAGDNSTDARTLMQWADRALYKAKEGGRNRVFHYDLAEQDSSEGLDENSRHNTKKAA